MDPRSAIIDAAARLLQEQGAAALTTRGVAEAAGVQPPTLYRLFGDKDGLIDAVAEHVMATYVAAKSEPIDPDPVADLRAAWRMHNDFGLANPELYALLNRRGPNSPATVAGIEVLRARVRRLATAGVLRVSEERALELIHAAGSGTVLALLSTPPEQRDSGLADAMLEAVLAAILTDSPTALPAGPAAVAIQFATLIDELPALSDAERALLGEWVARAIAAMNLAQTRGSKLSMNAKIDRRFSDPAAEPTSWATTEAALAAAELYWITTVRVDGRPHVTPLIGLWHDGALHFCTGLREQKFRNLEHSHRVAMTTGTNTWAQGLDVVVEGTAVQVTDNAELQRIADAYVDKYGEVWRFTVGDGVFDDETGGPAAVFRIDASKVMAFAKEPHGQTTYV